MATNISSNLNTDSEEVPNSSPTSISEKPLQSPSSVKASWVSSEEKNDVKSGDFDANTYVPPLRKIEDLLEKFQDEVNQLSEMVESKDEWKKSMEHEDVELLMLRYMVGHGTVQAAVKELTKSIELRIMQEAWNIEVPKEGDLQPMSCPHREIMDSLKPGYMSLGRSKCGRPITASLLGRMKVKEFVSQFSIEEYARNIRHNLIWNMRKLNQLSRESGYLIDTFLILDLAELGMGHWQFISYLKSDAFISQSLCPETSGVICVVNAPSIFSMMWAAMKVVLNANTLAKVKIFPGKGDFHLQRLIDGPSLSEMYGGKFHTSLENWMQENYPVQLYTEVYIANGSESVVEYILREPRPKRINLKIQTKAKDIGLVVSFESTEKDSGKKTEEFQDTNIGRFQNLEKNYNVPETAEVLKLTFDNTFSYWNGKNVLYTITEVNL